MTMEDCNMIDDVFTEGVAGNSPESAGSEYAAQRDAKIRKLMESAEKISAPTSAVPQNFLLSGTHRGRPYMDSDCSVVEVVYIHQIGRLWGLCSGDSGCGICAHARWWDRKRPGLSDKWRFKSSYKAISYFRMDSTTSGNGNIILGKPAILVGPPALEAAIKGIVRQSSREALERDFDPSIEMPLWQIVKTRDSVEITRAMDMMACPPLPESFPPLARFNGIHEFPTEDVVSRFKAAIDEAYSEYLAYSDPR